MSATRDKSQKITFNFSNFYDLYKKGKQAAKNAELPSEQAFASSASGTPVPPPFHPSAHQVLKVEDLNAPSLAVREHRPAEFIGKRVPKPPVLQPSTAIVTLRENLKSLTELHSRLKFMLEELEELVK
jgi:hypothetical protein